MSDTTDEQTENATQDNKSENNSTKKSKEKPTSQLTKKQQSDIAESVYTTETSIMNPIEWKQTEMVVQKMMQSKAIPKGFENAEQVFMVVQAGREVGFKPVQAVQSFYIVNGAIRAWGRAVPTLLRMHGWNIKYTNEDGSTQCTVELTNVKTGEKIEETYYYDDAVKSGYTQDSQGRLKFGWKEGVNRRKKLRYGALGLAIDTHIPEVLTSHGIMGVAEVEQDYSGGLEQRHLQEETGNVRSRIENAVAAKKGTIIDTETDFKPTPIED